MSGISFDEANRWRVEVKKKLESCEYDTKVNCINPQDYYNFLDNTNYDSEREIMEFDLYKLRTSDIVVVNFNNVYSLGTMAEIATAYELRKPILGLNRDNSELHPWQKEMCSKIFSNMDNLLNYIKNYYL